MNHDDVKPVKWPEKFNEVPKEVFHREDVFRNEMDRVFGGPEWHVLAHCSEVPGKGDYKSAHIGRTPVFVVHGDDGQVRVFLNACTHRGTILTTAPAGNVRMVECPYHRWTFNTRGDLMGVPGVGDFLPGFDKAAHGLKQVRSAQAFGLVFATLSDEAPELDEWLGEARDYIGRIAGGDGRLKLLGYQKVRFASNWKAYSDNEGYHGPLLHAAFRHLRFSEGKGHQFITANGHKVNCAELGAAQTNGLLQDPSVIEGRDPRLSPHNIIVNLYPTTVMTRNLDVISVRFATPRAVDETEVHYAYFTHEDDDEELTRHRVRQASNLIGPSGFISLEDGAVFNRVQSGSHTPGNVAFQKGVRAPLQPPCALDKGDEAGNLVRWDRYRRSMGFEA